MKKLINVDLNPLLQMDINVPIQITHDANAGVMAQWLKSEYVALTNKTMVYYLAGEGIGAGVISDGKLFLGESGKSTEIGHISLNIIGEACDCGNRGCLETYCSSIAFVNKALKLLPRYPSSVLSSIPNLSYKDIFEASRQNDPLALLLVREAGVALGYGAVNIINAFDPSEIIVGAEMAEGGDLILSEIRRVVNERALSPSVDIKLEDNSIDQILLGSASVAIEMCLNNPELLLVTAQ